MGLHALVSSDNGAALGDLTKAVAQWYNISDEAALAAQVSKDLSTFADCNSIVILEFREAQQPRIIDVRGLERAQDLETYVTGLYSVDPFYEMFAAQRRSGVFRINLEQGVDAELSEGYRRHVRRAPGKDEIGFLLEISPDHCIHLSLLVSLDAKHEMSRLLAFCEALIAPLTGAFRQCVIPVSPEALEDAQTRRQVHVAVFRAIESFGENILTPREQEVGVLLLKGHSAKSIARVLDIAPGTAALHRANVYRKLGINGQGDLFSTFLGQLMTP